METVHISTASGSVQVSKDPVYVKPGQEIVFDGTSLAAEFALRFDRKTLKGKKENEWHSSGSKKLEGKIKGWWWFWEKNPKYDVRVPDYPVLDPRIIIRRPNLHRLLEIVIGFIAGFIAGVLVGTRYLG